MKIKIIEYWTDREEPLVISYDTIANALHRFLGIYNMAHIAPRRDELLPKAELIITMLDENED